MQFFFQQKYLFPEVNFFLEPAETIRVSLASKQLHKQWKDQCQLCFAVPPTTTAPPPTTTTTTTTTSHTARCFLPSLKNLEICRLLQNGWRVTKVPLENFERFSQQEKTQLFSHLTTLKLPYFFDVSRLIYYSSQNDIRLQLFEFGKGGNEEEEEGGGAKEKNPPFYHSHVLKSLELGGGPFESENPIVEDDNDASSNKNENKEKEEEEEAGNENNKSLFFTTFAGLFELSLVHFTQTISHPKAAPQKTGFRAFMQQLSTWPNLQKLSISGKLIKEFDYNNVGNSGDAVSSEEEEEEDDNKSSEVEEDEEEEQEEEEKEEKHETNNKTKKTSMQYHALFSTMSKMMGFVTGNIGSSSSGRGRQEANKKKKKRVKSLPTPTPTPPVAAAYFPSLTTLSLHEDYAEPIVFSFFKACASYLKHLHLSDNRPRNSYGLLGGGGGGFLLANSDWQNHFPQLETLTVSYPHLDYGLNVEIFSSFPPKLTHIDFTFRTFCILNPATNPHLFQNIVNLIISTTLRGGGGGGGWNSTSISPPPGGGGGDDSPSSSSSTFSNLQFAYEWKVPNLQTLRLSAMSHATLWFHPQTEFPMLQTLVLRDDQLVSLHNLPRQCLNHLELEITKPSLFEENVLVFLEQHKISRVELHFRCSLGGSTLERVWGRRLARIDAYILCISMCTFRFKINLFDFLHIRHLNFKACTFSKKPIFVIPPSASQKKQKESEAEEEEEKKEGQHSLYYSSSSSSLFPLMSSSSLASSSSSLLSLQKQTIALRSVTLPADALSEIRKEEELAWLEQYKVQYFESKP